MIKITLSINFLQEEDKNKTLHKSYNNFIRDYFKGIKSQLETIIDNSETVQIEIFGDLVNVATSLYIKNQKIDIKAELNTKIVIEDYFRNVGLL